MAHYLILENNDFTPLTLNSIRAHDDSAAIKVMPAPAPGASWVGASLEQCSEQTVVLKSGVVWRGDDTSIPEKSIKYPLCIAETGVYSDSYDLAHTYDLIGSNITAGMKDMSVFIISPKLWVNIPETDVGLMKKVKKARMPRYMNHKEDPCFKEAIAPHQALYYNVLGLSAVANNYVGCLKAGEATVTETIAYPFDILMDYTEGLGYQEKAVVEKLGHKTLSRVGVLRNGLAKMNGVRDVR